MGRVVNRLKGKKYMKLKKKRIRNSAKAKMKSIEKAIKIGMDNLYSNVSYLLQEL